MSGNLLLTLLGRWLSIPESYSSIHPHPATVLVIVSLVHSYFLYETDNHSLITLGATRHASKSACKFTGSAPKCPMRDFQQSLCQIKAFWRQGFGPCIPVPSSWFSSLNRSLIVSHVSSLPRGNLARSLTMCLPAGGATETTPDRRIPFSVLYTTRLLRSGRKLTCSDKFSILIFVLC